MSSVLMDMPEHRFSPAFAFLALACLMLAAPAGAQTGATRPEPGEKVEKMTEAPLDKPASKAGTRKGPDGWDLLTTSARRNKGETESRQAQRQTTLSVMGMSAPRSQGRVIDSGANLTTGTEESGQIRESAMQAREVESGLLGTTSSTTRPASANPSH